MGCAESGWGMLGYRLRSELGCSHKVLTYVEYRAGFGVFQNIDSPPPSPPSECVRPPHQRRGGTHSPGGDGGGGSIFWKTPAIGLASYNNLSTLYNISLLSARLTDLSNQDPAMNVAQDPTRKLGEVKIRA